MTEASAPADAVREALDNLQRAEAEYRLMHDLHGDGSRAAGRAWDLMRRAGDKARQALATPDEAAATGSAEAITPELLGEVMQDSWGEICDDAGAHPDDIQKVGRKTFYQPRHWTDLIALRLNERLASTPRVDEAAIIERCARTVEATLVLDHASGKPWPPREPTRAEFAAAIRAQATPMKGGE